MSRIETAVMSANPTATRWLVDCADLMPSRRAMWLRTYQFWLTHGAWIELSEGHAARFQAEGYSTTSESSPLILGRRNLSRTRQDGSKRHTVRRSLSLR